MQIIRDRKKMTAYARVSRKQQCLIGFVPTMGALHEGHLSLVRASQKECDRTVVSIFVNPLQFAMNEDLSKYPRTIEADLRLLREEKVDCVFLPSATQMYPERFSTTVEEASLVDCLCGAVRPGHFKGVTTIVAKLFNSVQPDIAYFGRKDYQQALIIKKMALDLDLPIQVKIQPTVRDTDGLALSSRNRYLSLSERSDASNIYKALVTAKKMIEKGERKTKIILQTLTGILGKTQRLKVQYAEIRDAETLETIDRIDRSAVIAVAVFVGTTRLIDNMVVRARGKKVFCEL